MAVEVSNQKNARQHKRRHSTLTAHYCVMIMYGHHAWIVESIPDYVLLQRPSRQECDLRSPAILPGGSRQRRRAGSVISSWEISNFRISIDFRFLRVWVQRRFTGINLPLNRDHAVAT